MAIQLPENVSSLDEIMQIGETYEDMVELISQFAERKVSHAIFLIDQAVSAWESAGRKPAGLRKDIEFFLEFQDAFSRWQRQSILDRRIGGVEKRVQNLEHFLYLCSRFEEKYSQFETGG